MGAPRSARRSRSPVLALALLTLGGCDKLTGGDESSKDDDAAKTAALEEAEKEVELARKEAELARKETELARREAEGRAAEHEAKQAELEAKQADGEPTEPTPEKGGHPVDLSNIAVSGSGGLFGRSGMIELTARATLNQALGSSTYVHVKSRCKKDDGLIADVGHLNAHYSKPLEQYAMGEEAEVKGTLYGQGLKSSLSPCQFEFRVGGISGGLSVPVGHACWDGKAVADGKCQPALAPVAMSGAGAPIEVEDLQVERGGGLGGTKGLNLTYLLQINAAQDSSVRLTFKSACRVGTKAFVDMGQANLMAGPFQYESGESVARAANLYWSSAFELTHAPNDCDLTTSLWKTKAGTFGEYEEQRLADSCFKDDKLRDGRCNPSAPAPLPATPLATESVTVDDVRFELTEPHGMAGKFQLKVQADVTVHAPVNQNDGATAKVSCKTGKDTRVESAYLFGPELYYLQAGETARMTANAFGSHALDAKPKSCKVQFFGGPRFSPSGTDGVDLGEFCLKKDKVKKGGKC